VVVSRKRSTRPILMCITCSAREVSCHFARCFLVCYQCKCHPFPLQETEVPRAKYGCQKDSCKICLPCSTREVHAPARFALTVLPAALRAVVIRSEQSRRKPSNALRENAISR
jgi:hypothetical protein